MSKRTAKVFLLAAVLFILAMLHPDNIVIGASFAVSFAFTIILTVADLFPPRR